MTDFFLSYSHRDKDYVWALADALRSRGHKIWTDEETMPGSKWRDVLAKSLSSAEIVVFVISNHSLQSQNVRAEMHAAAAFVNDNLEIRAPIVPIIIDDTHMADLPPILVPYQALYVTGQGVAEVATTLERVAAEHAGMRAAAEAQNLESRKRLEHNAADYIEGAVSAQRKGEHRYRWFGIVWYGLGLVFLALGLIFVAVALLHLDVPSGDWTAFALVAFRALVVIALLGACAKYSFSLGRAFTIEAMKCSDRLHAISFGEFYLRAYGDTAQWQDLKEAFADWNIDRPSAFSSTSASEFDPKLIELVTSVVNGVVHGKGK